MPFTFIGRFGRLKSALEKSLGPIREYCIAGTRQRYAVAPPLELRGIVAQNSDCIAFRCNAVSNGYFAETFIFQNLETAVCTLKPAADLVCLYESLTDHRFPAFRTARNTRRWTFRNLWIESGQQRLEWHFPQHFHQSDLDLKLEFALTDIDRIVEQFLGKQPEK